MSPSNNSSSTPERTDPVRAFWEEQMLVLLAALAWLPGQIIFWIVLLSVLLKRIG
jgi:hypothetical protein